MSSSVVSNSDPAPIDARHPWPGLASFDESNSAFFFGRTAEISELERLIINGPACLLFGRSGLGKTSLLCAGVFPLLRENNYLPVYVRLNHAEDAPPLAEQVKQELSSALKSSKIEARPPVAAESLWEYSHRDDVDFWDARVRLITPVLVFDQFEEIFTLGRRSESRTAAFLKEMQALINNSPPEELRKRFESDPELVGRFDFEKRTVKVLLALREDYLAHFDSLRKQFHSLGQYRMRLEPLSGTQALEAVLKPGQGIVEEPVAVRIIGFVSRDNPRGDNEPLTPENLSRCVVEPALLSVVCRELNQRRLDSGHPKITEDVLNRQAREEILAGFYEKAVGDMPPQVRAFVEDQLLTTAGYRDRAALDDALRIPGVGKDHLETLVTRRLLRQEEVNGVTWIELTHDLLTGVVQQSRVHREQRQAEYARRKAERDARKYKLVIGFVSCLALVALIALLFANSSIREARKANREVGEANDAYRQQNQKALDALNEKEKAVHNASKRDQYTAEQLFDKGEWGPGLAYLARSLREVPNNSPAAIDFYSAVVYGRNGDGKLPDYWITNNNRASYAILNSSGDRALISTINGISFLQCTINEVDRFKLADFPTTFAIFSPTGERLLTSQEGQLQIWNPIHGQTNGQPLQTLKSAPELVLGKAFSPDGTRLVLTGVNYRNSGCEAGIWDITNGSPTFILPHKSWVPGAAFSQDGAYVVTAGGVEGVAHVWEAATGKWQTNLVGHADWVMGAAFSPHDNNLIVTWSYDKTARIWDRRSAQSLHTLQHEGKVVWAAFNGDGSHLVTASADGTVHIWNTNGAPLTEPLQHRGRVVKAVFSTYTNGHEMVLTTCSDNSVHLWDAATGKPLAEPFLHGSRRGEARLLDAAFGNLGGPRVLTESAEGSGVWSISDSRPGMILTNASKVWCVRFNTNGTRLVTASADGIARIWDVSSTGGPILTLTNISSNAVSYYTSCSNGEVVVPSHPQANMSSKAIRYAEFSLNGDRIVTAGEDNLARIWNARNGELIYELAGHTDYIRVAKFSPDGKQVLTASMDGTARIWNLSVQPPAVKKLEHDGPVLWADFSPDGKSVVTASMDGTAKIWAANKDPVVIKHQGFVQYAAFSPTNGLKVVIASSVNAQVWDSATRQPTPLLRRGESLLMARFSPDGNWIATASVDGSVRIYNVKTGKPAGRSLHHKDAVNSVDFSPDGKFLLTASADATARLWKIEDKGNLAPFGEPLPHQGEVLQASFNPVPAADGRYLFATASDDDTARIWKTPPETGWDASMTNHIPRDIIPDIQLQTAGEAFAALLSSYYFDTNGELQQLNIDERFKLKKYFNEQHKFGDTNWNELLDWWQTPPKDRRPWPEPATVSR